MGVENITSIFHGRNLRGAFGSSRAPLAVHDNRTVSSTDAMAANLSRVYLLHCRQEGEDNHHADEMSRLLTESPTTTDDDYDDIPSFSLENEIT